MPKPEADPNGSRKLIDFLNGEGPFSERLTLEIGQLKKVYADLSDAMQAQTQLAGRRHAQVMGAIEGIRRSRKAQPQPEEQWDDDDEITDVEDRDVLRQRARGQRARATRTRRIAQAIAPVVAILGAVVWELLRTYVAR